jgi:hypothetical protein
MIRRKKQLPSLGNGEPASQHPDAQSGARIAFQNAEQGPAPPEHQSRINWAQFRLGKSAKGEQRDGRATTEADRQGTNTRSDSQSTPSKLLPSLPQILPMQGQGIRGSTSEGNPNEGMDRIFDEILKIQKHFPSIRFEREITRPFSLSDVETALVNVAQAYGGSLHSIRTSNKTIENMEQQYQTLRSESENDLGRRIQEHKETISRLKSDKDKTKSYFEGKISVYEVQQQQQEKVISEGTLQIQQLNGDLTSHVGEIKRLKEQQQKDSKAASAELATTMSHFMGQRSQMEQKLSEQGRKVEQERKVAEELQSEKQALEEDVRLAKVNFESQLRQTRRQLDQERKGKVEEIERIQNAHEREKREVERQFMEERSKMKHELLEQNRKVAEELQSEKQALEEDLRLAKVNFESQLEQTKGQLDQERKGKAKEIERIQNAHDAEKRKMREDFEVEKTGLVRGLKETVESLKGALVERDHFKTMSDHELARRFQDISIEVDEFARVQWDSGQESLWPFPGQSFRKSENQRRTKQYIIQNTLWVVLYESIFCTPFRILGNQGKSLEATWIEKFGQGKPTHNCSFSVAKMHKIPNLQERRLFFHRRLKNRRNGGTRP